MMPKSPFPYFLIGTIVRGFGRGSKELGCPTANLDEKAVEQLPSTLNEGVYYGWGQLVNDDDDDENQRNIYKMVTSIGTNPFYHGEKKTIETHLMHKFTDDFYGKQLKVILLGELRPMTTFANANELMRAIQKDIQNAERLLDSENSRRYLRETFFENLSK